IIWIPHTHMITAVAVSRLSLDQIEISKCGWSINGVAGGLGDERDRLRPDLRHRHRSTIARHIVEGGGEQGRQ
ncbi:hypothetical protein, partial [Nonomuraea fastidiosa]